VVEGADGDSARQLERPADDAELPAAYEAAAARLVGALESADPAAPAWSWHDDGGTVGWVLRRQAHEALVHRVDAEQTAGVPVTAPPADVARDGVDELLTVMLDGVPSWGTLTLDGSVVRVAVPDGGSGRADWTVRLGRFRGTGPESGREFDLEAASVTVEDVPAGGTVAGDAWALDLWLWGRGELPAGAADGDPALVERLRRTVADGTQ